MQKHLKNFVLGMIGLILVIPICVVFTIWFFIDGTCSFGEFMQEEIKKLIEKLKRK